MGDLPSIAGQVLAEKYLLIERLGEGGFGSIWRAEHLVLKSTIAVKLIDLGIASREGAVERFLREAQATAALRSPHVVQVLDYGLDRREDENGVPLEQPFIAMELLEGENLAERITRLGKLSALETVRIVTHVARAMSKAHELGIVHRDLKPENIFIVNNGDDEIVKVLDFGVAKIASPVKMDLNTYTQTGSMVGTPYYMSPEQAQGNKAVDYRSDLWALGVLAFEMLTGLRPFDSDALGDLVLSICVREPPVPSSYGAVPEGFDAWFAHAVARNPEDRFQSARELALALLAVVETGGEGGVRYTQFDDRTVRPPVVKPEPAPGEALIPEIPSRPHQSAFAATIRDDALELAALDESESSPVKDAATTSIQPEEHLGPWSLFGMAVIALGAGAAAVYGIFNLLGNPASVEEPSTLATSAAQSSARSKSGSPQSKQRPVTATQRQNQASTASGKPGTSVPEPEELSPPANGSGTPSPEVAPQDPSKPQLPESSQDVPEPQTPLEDSKASDYPSVLEPNPAATATPPESTLPVTESVPMVKSAVVSEQPTNHSIDALPMVTD